MDKVAHTLLFSTGAHRSLDEDAEKIQEIVIRYFTDYTIFHGQGIWKNRKELAYQLLIIASTGDSLDSLIADLKSAFRQDSIMEIRHEASTVVFH